MKSEIVEFIKSGTYDEVKLFLFELFLILEATLNGRVSLGQIETTREAEFELGVEVIPVKRVQGGRTVIEHSTASVHAIAEHGTSSWSSKGH